MKKYILLGIIGVALCLVLILLLILPRISSTPRMEEVPELIDAYEGKKSDTKSGTVSEKPGVQPEESYKSPIDFAALQAENPDIYAWLDIPGTDISYPIVQNEDDTFYLDHDINGDKKACGAIFTENAYNRTDLKDPVTVIYGHHMKAGTMFGNLQEYYWDADSFKEHKNITIYTPEEEICFEVFLAGQYSNEHLLYGKNYYKQEQKEQLVESIRNTHQIGGCFDEETEIEYHNRFIVLSTCLQGNRRARCLVVAQEVVK